jgi:hypothetical protein
LFVAGNSGTMHKLSTKPITLPADVDQLNEWLLSLRLKNKLMNSERLSVPRNKLVVRVMIVPK